MTPSVELDTALTTARTLVRELLTMLMEASHPSSLEKAESPSIMLLASLLVKNGSKELAKGAAEQATAKPGSASLSGLSRHELLKRLDKTTPQQLVDDYVLRQSHISARTRYNLACYYTTLAKCGGDETRKGCLELALGSLKRSLEVGGLTEWAGKDPSLQLLRTELPKRFAEALADHALSPHTAPSVAPPEEKGEEDEGEGEQIDPLPLLADLLATAGPEADIVAGDSEQGFDYAVRGPAEDVLIVATENPAWTQTEALFDAAEAWKKEEGTVPRLVLGVPGGVKPSAPIVREKLTIDVLPIDAKS